MRRQTASRERVEDTLLGGRGRGGADKAVDVADVRESEELGEDVCSEGARGTGEELFHITVSLSHLKLEGI